jgi:hypothetical protein
VSLRVRLRIELNDAPGSLAQVAAIIADHGGNITGLDVLEGSRSSAVDDVTVEFGEPTDLTGLRRELTSSGAARVLSHQTASPVDLLVRVLRRLAEIVPGSTEQSDDLLRRGVAELCATPAVWVCGPMTALDSDAGRLAMEHPGEGAVVRTAQPLPPLGYTASGEAWLLAVAERADVRAQRVVLVSRPLTQAFTTTEVARVEALVAVHQRLDSLASQAGERGVADAHP